MTALCEHCFGPVNSMSYMAGDYLRHHPQLLATLPDVTVQTCGPDTGWLPVWWHSRCFAETLRSPSERS